MFLKRLERSGNVDETLRVDTNFGNKGGAYCVEVSARTTPSRVAWWSAATDVDSSSLQMSNCCRATHDPECSVSMRQILIFKSWFSQMRPLSSLIVLIHPPQLGIVTRNVFVALVAATTHVKQCGGSITAHRVSSQHVALSMGIGQIGWS